MPLVCLVPFASDLDQAVEPSSGVLWAAVASNRLLIEFAKASGFNCIFLLINNSVPREILGVTNGVSMTLASVGKGMGPGVGGALYALSLTNPSQAYPVLDHHMCFWVMGALFAIQLSLAHSLSPALETPYDED